MVPSVIERQCVYSPLIGGKGGRLLLVISIITSNRADVVRMHPITARARGA